MDLFGSGSVRQTFLFAYSRISRSSSIVLTVIEISLIDPAFKAGKPGFERVKRLLRAWPGETQLFEQLKGESLGSRTFDLLMAYVDDEGKLSVRL